ncbi:MAG: pantoate--beta-alanine ligase [Campylobacteraceae bacterium]|nr:pantoate--beta-alanine ligase [Campylobacteraceae bacterium]
MKIFSTPKDLANDRQKMEGTIGLVPTMGALHQGHLSLIKRSVAENDNTIVSIFVNPTQFLPGEDLEAYPRRLESDLKLCRLAGVDVVFTPTPEVIYFKNELTICAPSILGFVLEGVKRPGHFDGVLSIVLKLLNLTSPTHAYFGKKDAQQLRLIQKMVADYFLNIIVVPCDIVRDEEGLAISSRNVYLSENERIEALKLSKALELASRFISKGGREIKPIEALMQETLKPLNVEYAKVLSRDFTPLESVKIGSTLIAVCAHVGKTRLIDNIWI